MVWSVSMYASCSKLLVALKMAAHSADVIPVWFSQFVDAVELFLVAADEKFVLFMIVSVVTLEA